MELTSEYRVSAEAVRETEVRTGSNVKRVLLAEDHGVLKALLLRALRERGFEVVPADDGEQALQLFEHHAQQIDLVLTDVVMPNRDGFELAREIRARRPDTPVIYISGYVDASELWPDVPPGHLMTKPLSLLDLLSKVDELVGSP